MRSHGMSALDNRRGRAQRGIVQVMAVADRRSWSRLRGRVSARATKNRKWPVEAAGAMDAKNAPTAPLKTGGPVSHSYHRLLLLFTGKPEKCHPCSRLTLLPMFPVAPFQRRKQTLDVTRHRAPSDDLRPELYWGRGNNLWR
jgi:hypothetical protein